MTASVDREAIAQSTVAEMVPVAEAALTCRTRDGVVRSTARSLLRAHSYEATAIAYIAAEAMVQLAERAPAVDEPPALGDIRLAGDFPGYGAELGGGR